jgi:hypothetical protein
MSLAAIVFERGWSSAFLFSFLTLLESQVPHEAQDGDVFETGRLIGDGSVYIIIS